jgi:hypothetical protein
VVEVSFHSNLYGKYLIFGNSSKKFDSRIRPWLFASALSVFKAKYSRDLI